jgi:hypothetical protein
LVYEKLRDFVFSLMKINLKGIQVNLLLNSVEKMKKFEKHNKLPVHSNKIVSLTVVDINIT